MLYMCWVENRVWPGLVVPSWQGLQRRRLRAVEVDADPESESILWLWEGKTLPTNDRVRPV